jgi:hypothetical protein
MIKVINTGNGSQKERRLTVITDTVTFQTYTHVQAYVKMQFI